MVRIHHWDALGFLFVFVLEGLISFLQECSKVLKPGGLICIKDNVILPKPVKKFARSAEEEEAHDVLLDQEDCSVTRSERYLLELAKAANLEMVSREVQVKFPKEIFPVVMYAFKVQ